MDSDIEELKEELKIQRKLLEDTNRMVHKMHRSALWGRIFTMVWWGALLVITGSVYYYFLLPYLDQVIALYNGVQQGAEQGQSLFSQVQELIRQYTQ